MHKIIWKSSPLTAGDTLMLYGGDFEEDTKIYAARLDDTQSADTEPDFQPLCTAASAQCLTAVIPQAFGNGVYAVFTKSSADRSEILYINRPEIIWHMGDEGEFATRGGTLRLFGKQLMLDAAVKPSVRLDTGSEKTELEVITYDKYDVTVRIPEHLANGTYTVYLYNGFGGVSAESAGYRFSVSDKTTWKQDIFNVRDFGASGRYGSAPDDEADDTEAIRSALEAAKENGGGIVYLPRGTYKVTEKLVIPRYVTVRGEKMEAVWIYVPGIWYHQPEIDSVFAGNGDFAIEELSIASSTAKKIVAAPDRPEMYELPWGYPMKIKDRPKANNIRLHRLRIQHLRYWPRIGIAENLSMNAEEIQGDLRRLENNGPSSVILSGDHLEISDCDILGCGMTTIIHDTRYSIMRNNFIHGGRGAWCYTWWGAYCSIMENNTIEGRDLEAGGGGFSNWNNSGSDLTKIYIAKNITKCLFGGEREGLCFDSSTTPELYPWTGKADRYTINGMQLNQPKWKPGKMKRLACLVVRGHGMGQIKRILDNTGDTVLLEEDWDLLPDESSIIAIISYRRDVIMYKNQAIDTSTGIEFWGGTYDYIIDSNSEVRTGGSWGRAAQYKEREGDIFLPHYFTQWINNRMSEGFVYEIGNARLFGYLGIRGGSCKDPRMAIGIPAVGNIYRGNVLDEGMRIYLEGDDKGLVGKHTVIEHNTLSNTPVGIEIRGKFEDTILRENTMNGVERPLFIYEAYNGKIKPS